VGQQAADAGVVPATATTVTLIARAVTPRRITSSHSRGGTGSQESYGTSRVEGMPLMTVVSPRVRVTLR
jgi:hypothetical protein